MMRLCIAYLDAPGFGPGALLRVPGNFVVYPEESISTARRRIAREIGERPERITIKIID